MVDGELALEGVDDAEFVAVGPGLVAQPARGVEVWIPRQHEDASQEPPAGAPSNRCARDIGFDGSVELERLCENWALLTKRLSTGSSLGRVTGEETGSSDPANSRLLRHPGPIGQPGPAATDAGPFPVTCPPAEALRRRNGCPREARKGRDRGGTRTPGRCDLGLAPPARPRFRRAVHLGRLPGASFGPERGTNRARHHATGRAPRHSRRVDRRAPRPAEPPRRSHHRPDWAPHVGPRREPMDGYASRVDGRRMGPLRASPRGRGAHLFRRIPVPGLRVRRLGARPSRTGSNRARIRVINY